VKIWLLLFVVWMVACVTTFLWLNPKVFESFSAPGMQTSVQPAPPIDPEGEAVSSDTPED